MRQLTWSFNVLPFHPAVENLLLLLCCHPVWILKRKVLQDGHCLVVRAELIGQASCTHCVCKAKLTCLVFRTQCSLGELICSIMLVLPSCIRGRVRARWTQGREMSDPIRTSQKATGMLILNENGENAPCSSQRSTAQWSNAAEERLLPRTQIDKLCSAYFLERRPESILCLLWDLLAECFGSCFCLSGVFATLATICWHWASFLGGLDNGQCKSGVSTGHTTFAMLSYTRPGWVKIYNCRVNLGCLVSRGYQKSEFVSFSRFRRTTEVHYFTSQTWSYL